MDWIYLIVGIFIGTLLGFIADALLSINSRQDEIERDSGQAKE